MTDVMLDAAADGAFSGKLADPADVLTKRGGKGDVVFEGVPYTKLAWIRRSARLGHTLAAGEGAMLEAEVTRLRALVASAYDEGQGNRVLGDHQQFLRDIPWHDSDACKALESP